MILHSISSCSNYSNYSNSTADKAKFDQTIVVECSFVEGKRNIQRELAEKQ